jgi:hypothetical protein
MSKLWGFVAGGSAGPTTISAGTSVAFGGAAFAPDENLVAADSYNAALWGLTPAQLTAGTWPSNPLAQSTGPTGAGLWALNNVEDVAFDTAGNIWVVDNQVPSSLVVKFNYDAGTVDPNPPVQLWADAGIFDSCVSLAFDAHHNLWVACQASQTIVEINAGTATTGALTATAVVRSSAFSGPTGVAFDNLGRLWVIDQGTSTTANTLLRFDSPSSFSGSVTTSPQATFNGLPAAGLNGNRMQFYPPPSGTGLQ